MSRQNAAPDDSPRWYLGLTLLGLDRVEPFLGAMDVQVSRPVTLQALSQDFVRRYRTIEYDPTLSDADRLHLRQALVTETVDEILAGLGTAEGRRVVQWVTRTLGFDPQEAAAAQVYKQTLRRLHRAGEASRPLAGLSAPGQKAVAQAVDRHAAAIDDLTLQLTASRASTAAPYDQAAVDTEIASAGPDPMDWVDDAAQNLAAHRCWSRLTDSLDPSDRAVLLGLARQEAARMGLSARLVDVTESEALSPDDPSTTGLTEL